MSSDSPQPERKPIELPAEPAGERRRFAEQVASSLNVAGVPAAVLLSDADLIEFMRKHADQILAAAASCRFPEVRTQLEEIARTALAQLDGVGRKTH